MDQKRSLYTVCVYIYSIYLVTISVVDNNQKFVHMYEILTNEYEYSIAMQFRVPSSIFSMTYHKEICFPRTLN